MHIYFSGIGGKGIASLAHIALDAGYHVYGSELEQSSTTDDLVARGVNISFNQDGAFLEELSLDIDFDWLIHTAAIKPSHPELETASRLGIAVAKRHEFINSLLYDKSLKLIAISGSHGKTTTSSMLVWLFKKYKIPLSYSVGADLPFGNGGAFKSKSEWLVLEADEFDKNMLRFAPVEAVIVNIDYDHKDTYPTRKSYEQAFEQFLKQSNHAFIWSKDAEKIKVEKKHTIFPSGMDLSSVLLSGDHNKSNAWLAANAFLHINQENEDFIKNNSINDVLEQLHDFPGARRRMERLAKNIYSDFAHTPEEIAATLQAASESYENIVVVYQPHQNIRQHELMGKYEDCFSIANKVYWVPTFLSREDSNQKILAPNDLLPKKETGKFEITELNNNLADSIKSMSSSHTIICMGAGDIDKWARNNLT